MKLLLQAEAMAGSAPNLAARLLSDMRIFIKHVDIPKPKWVQATETTDWLLEVEPAADGPGFKLINHQLVYKTASSASITLGRVDHKASGANHDGLLNINAEAFRAASLGYLTQQLDQKKQQLDEQVKNKESSGISYVCPLTLEVMEDPVTAPDGITYERRALIRHLTSNHASATRSPATNKPFENLANFNVYTTPQNFLYKQLVQAHLPILSEITALQRDIATLQPPLASPVRTRATAANHEQSPIRPHHIEYGRRLAATAGVARPYPVATPEVSAPAPPHHLRHPLPPRGLAGSIAGLDQLSRQEKPGKT